MLKAASRAKHTIHGKLLVRLNEKNCSLDYWTVRLREYQTTSQIAFQTTSAAWTYVSLRPLCSLLCVPHPFLFATTAKDFLPFRPVSWLTRNLNTPFPIPAAS